MPPRTTRRSLAVDPSDLTDNEGGLLGLIHAREPVTAYQLVKHHEDSALTNANASKGGVYAALGRLRDQGLIEGRAIEGDKRGTEALYCTDAGREALRRWAKDLREAYFVPLDGLRTKLMSFDLLSRDEQLDWIVDAKGHMTAQLDAVEAEPLDPSPFAALIRENAVSALKARLVWLDRLLHFVIKSPR